MPAENYNEYREDSSESMQSEIDAAINHAKGDLNDLQSEIIGGKKVDFKTPDSINNFYKLENGKVVFQLDQVKNYLSDVYKRLSGMKVQKFSEVSKENNFTGTILAIQITLKALETNPVNPKKYNIGKINGEYNELTQNAIKQFQTDYQLKYKDGKPGKETIGKMIKAIDDLIHNRQLEKAEKESIKSNVKAIIEESIGFNPYSGVYSNELKESMTNYIIDGNLNNTGKDILLESQINYLSNNPLNWKLKYLIKNSDKSLKNNIQYIQKEEELRRKNFQSDLNKLNQGGEGSKKNGKLEINQGGSDKYTFGHNLTESQKGTITNVLSGWKSPVTAKMVADSCQTSKNVPVEYLLAFMQNDSRVGTMGLGARTHNPGNVGNTGKTKKDRGTWEKGVKACAENLQKRIDAYLSAKNKNNGKGFNDFPTPEELATGKTKGGFRFFGIYMTAPNGPKKVAGMVKKWVDRLR